MQADHFRENPSYIDDLLTHRSVLLEPDVQKQLAAMLQGMLHPDVHCRMTAQELLTMPWLQ